MKISIIYDRSEKPEKSEFLEVHYSDLENIEDAVLTNVKLIDTIDYVRNPENLIYVTINKMRYGSEITVVGNDALCIADKIINGSLNINDMRNILYNEKKSISHFEHIERVLKQHGLNIELTNIDKSTNKYMIIARKPNV